ncbi:hypothetical protein H2248_010066 [Termitomyces sp. 'cryptogamus']|nr:hypothetical protein H2248_010066 [Termitomyces sp. 'cryptogamus']
MLSQLDRRNSSSNSTLETSPASSTSSTTSVGTTPLSVSSPTSAPSTITTNSTSTSITSMTSNPISTTNAGHSRRIGRIVGGVLGGVFGLAVLTATIIFCHRKRQNPSDLDLLRATRGTNVSPSPSLQEGMPSLTVTHFC